MSDSNPNSSMLGSTNITGSSPFFPSGAHSASSIGTNRSFLLNHTETDKLDQYQLTALARVALSNLNNSGLQPTNSGGGGNETTSALLEENLDRIQLIADVGYLLSLMTLVFALLILTCIKRLRSPKNNLHLQLFISFIVRCSFHLIQRLFIHDQLAGFSMDLDGWVCKFVTVIWQYTLLANYNWILMEGVYLYSLIFFTSISPYGPSIIGYIVFGWTMPLVCIIPWIVAKANYENTSCWLTNSNQAYFWILRAPITISILLNFIIYVRIVLVLYSKIFSGAMTLQTSKRDTENNYKKLLRSTLVLIPLFGVHYTALLLFQQWAEIYKFELAEVIWLYIETLFSSCQGCIVACLYCFLNDEVHQEIKRLWRRLT